MAALSFEERGTPEPAGCARSLPHAELLREWQSELASLCPEDVFASALRPACNVEPSAEFVAREEAYGGDSPRQCAEDLKQTEFMYLAVESHLQLLSGASHDAGAEGLEEWLTRQVAQEAAKYDALLEDIASELVSYGRLYEEIAKNVEEASNATPMGAPTAAASSRADGAIPATAERLSWELQLLDHHRAEARKACEKLMRSEEQERWEVQNLEALEVSESQLGLPRITFDDARGIVVLRRQEASIAGEEAPDGSTVLEVKVEWDDSGKLVSVEPHPSLDLWSEAATSVERDDLARILALVWDRANSESGGDGEPGVI